jgi:hypothetical protein
VAIVVRGKIYKIRYSSLTPTKGLIKPLNTAHNPLGHPRTGHTSSKNCTVSREIVRYAHLPPLLIKATYPAVPMRAS